MYLFPGDDANDRHIWTQASAMGLAFGKYGLESVRLLVRVWPIGIVLPRALLCGQYRGGGKAC